MHLQQRLLFEIIVNIIEIKVKTIRRIKAKLKTYNQHTYFNKMSAQKLMLLIYSAIRINL